MKFNIEYSYNKNMYGDIELEATDADHAEALAEEHIKKYHEGEDISNLQIDCIKTA